jgi:hypothetical protein
MKTYYMRAIWTQTPPVAILKSQRCGLCSFPKERNYIASWYILRGDKRQLLEQLERYRKESMPQSGRKRHVNEALRNQRKPDGSSSRTRLRPLVLQAPHIIGAC